MTQYKLNTPIKSFNTYVFDCDGVLLDSNRVKTEAFYHAALPYGEPAAQAFTEYHKANGGISRQKKFEYFFLNILNLSALPEEKYQKALNDYGKLTAEGLVRCEVLPGVLEFLTSLPAQAKKFVVSGGAQDEVRWVLEAKGLAKFFDGIYGNPVDKLTLVKNLDLKDSDYPGIFFGDARYDHEVAKANGLDFIFLSAVSDFDGWEEYVESHSLPAFESFTSLSLAAQIAEQKALMEKEQAESALPPEIVEKKRKAYFFGFPFSPIKRSPFTNRLAVGPIVAETVKNNLNLNVTIFTRSAPYYKDFGFSPVEHVKVFKDSSPMFNGGISGEDIANIVRHPMPLLSMMERHDHTLRRLVHMPFYQIGYEARKLLVNRIAFWLEQVKNDNIDIYINSNCPHLTDDLICYEVCRYLNLPRAFPYRMPIVVGLSARLYIPVDLYDHENVYDRNGNVISYDDFSGGEIYSNDLLKIYSEVVCGDETLSSLSKKELLRLGKPAPKQFIPPNMWAGWWKRIKGNLFSTQMIGSTRIMLSSKIVARKNKLELKKYATGSVPEDAPFIYYPLHMQPEASSNPLGGEYSDQLRAIRFLASRLPLGWKLVVKEHPLQKMEVRPVGFYSDLAVSDNVILVGTNVSSDFIQSKSKAVATLTGTAALEAWLKGKPSLVMGSILFSSAPGIYKITDNDSLDNALELISDGKIHNLSDIKNYLAFLEEATFFGHLDAYIDPCIPAYDLDLEENEREIGERLSTAINAQLKL